jgi:hypothetical protein
MDSSRFNRLLVGLVLAAGWTHAFSAHGAETLYLADGKTFPGKLWASESGGSERLAFQREAIANPAYPEAVMKLGHVAAGPDQKIYYCSGLDGYVLHLLDGRHEVLSFEFAGQVRDVACSDEEHVVYFSVVPTPQNGEPLADGKIYRRDLWQGQPTEAATVKQSEVGGAWWGNFSLRDRELYVATLEESSRVFKLTSAAPELVATANGYKISGFVWTGHDWLLAKETGRIYRTADFAAIEDAFLAVKPISDVAVGAGARP